MLHIISHSVRSKDVNSSIKTFFTITINMVCFQDLKIISEFIDILKQKCLQMLDVFR